MAIRLTLALAAILLLSACNKAADSASTASTQTESVPMTASTETATPATEAPAVEPAPVDETKVVGTTLALANGSSVTVEKISVVDSAPKDHAGLIAVAGHVEEVHPDKGVFMISDPKTADCVEEEGAKAAESCPCCPPGGSVPIKIALENYEGSLPNAEQAVVVVGELSPTETGYTFVVHEVRSGEEVLLTLKASAETPATEGASNA